ncbi:hypothetical protein V2J09_024048 [Rumex salicifolius]
MEGNEWINGYLEAILDTGGAPIDESATVNATSNNGGKKGQKKDGEGGLLNFNLTKYFVEEVVSGVDESDLHRTWLKVVATRNSMERSSRLENMCWRIWHLTRKKKQLESEHIQRLTERRLEREQGRMEVTEDMSEDLSEGEKVDNLGDSKEDSPRRKFKRDVSNLESWSESHKEKKLYMVLISLHGLVRGENMELGRDSDTGGQVKYVVELARALAKMPGVYRVDLFTRQILSPEVDWTYSEPTEMLTSEEEADTEGLGESSGAYIVRIPFGPRDKYLDKELLWPYIQEFVDGALAHVLNMSKVLGEQIGDGQPIWPYVIHGHYADAGDSAALLSGALNVPMVLTGHSLGRNKLEQLLKQGRHSMEDINSTYKIMRRIEAEELSLDAAELVITSTRQEIDEQWGLYDGFDVKLEKVLRARGRRGVGCHGRFMPRMAVIPPGMDFSNVVVQEEEAQEADEITSLASTESSSPKAKPAIWTEVMRFFTNPHKPMILALSRPDPKKNITTLLRAFGECRPLRELANLTLIMGNRDDIDEMASGNAGVLVTVLKLIDKYDLYGQVAYPKHHRQSDVPDIYRLAARTRGVFINPALVEPFGLTLIEAAAHGLPMVATKNGGPVDIQRALNNGLIVDPHDHNAIADALLKLVSEKNLWHECRRNGWKNINLYSWPEHCRIYLTRVAACRMRHPHWQIDTPLDECANESTSSLNDSLKDVQDMSLRLSIDADRSSLNGPSDFSGAMPDVQAQVQRLLSKIRNPEAEAAEFGDSKKSADKLPLLRRRRRLVVIALDCYDDNGAPDEKMIKVIDEIFNAVKMDPQTGKTTGFALSTAMPVSEVTEFFKSGKIQVSDFDALICCSGSEVYYPGVYTEEGGTMSPDPDYAYHIDYRWGNEGLTNTISMMLNVNEGKDEEKPSMSIVEDTKSSNAHCVSFIIKDRTQARKADDIRQRLRMRGLRCHPMYCRNATRLQVIPLLASRAQALRYLFVRWRVNVASMYVFMGETGDTDYEEMISGAHKTIVMKGVVKKGSEELHRAVGSYNREDTIPKKSLFTGYYTSGEIKAESIADLLKQLSKATNKM